MAYAAPKFGSFVSIVPKETARVYPTHYLIMEHDGACMMSATVLHVLFIDSLFEKESEESTFHIVLAKSVYLIF